MSHPTQDRPYRHPLTQFFAHYANERSASDALIFLLAKAAVLAGQVEPHDPDAHRQFMQGLESLIDSATAWHQEKWG